MVQAWQKVGLVVFFNLRHKGVLRVIDKGVQWTSFLLIHYIYAEFLLINPFLWERDSKEAGNPRIWSSYTALIERPVCRHLRQILGRMSARGGLGLLDPSPTANPVSPYLWEYARESILWFFVAGGQHTNSFPQKAGHLTIIYVRVLIGAVISRRQLWKTGFIGWGLVYAPCW